MSKKRPRTVTSPLGVPPLAGSKQQPAYWRERLFKSRYTYKGKLHEVHHWSVKIQHQGQRKTFSLRSSSRSQAATEACELYQALVRQDRKGAIPPGGLSLVPTRLQPDEPALAAADKFDIGYWEQRLIHREYTMSLEPAAPAELSVRIDHGGTGHYFPLGTDDRHLAARLALRIYQTIADQGWEAANKQFSRELTLAFRWLDVPLGWTYTTIHTLNMLSRTGPAEPYPGAAGVCEVAVAESDAGTRHALDWCINHMEGFRCVATFGSAAEALRESMRRRVHLVLVSHSLADKPGTVCLAEIKIAVPEVCGLL